MSRPFGFLPAFLWTGNSHSIRLYTSVPSRVRSIMPPTYLSTKVIQILSENQEIEKSLKSRPFWFLFAFQHFTVQQKFPFVVINVTVHAEVRSLLPKGCSISKPHDFWRATFTVTRHFFSFRTAFIITDHSAIWYIFSLHLRRLIGVGQTNDSLSRLVGVSSMYSKKSCFSHFNSFSPFFPF